MLSPPMIINAITLAGRAADKNVEFSRPQLGL